MAELTRLVVSARGWRIEDTSAMVRLPDVEGWYQNIICCGDDAGIEFQDRPLSVGVIIQYLTHWGWMVEEEEDARATRRNKITIQDFRFQKQLSKKLTRTKMGSWLGVYEIEQGKNNCKKRSEPTRAGTSRMKSNPTRGSQVQIGVIERVRVQVGLER